MEKSWKSDPYFLEYSVEQKCFHIARLSEILRDNNSLVRRQACNGYVIIAGPFDDIGQTAMPMKKLYEEFNEAGMITDRLF